MEKEVDLENKWIKLNFFNEVDEATENALNNQLANNKNYIDLKAFKIKVKGSKTKSFDLITTAYTDARKELNDSKTNIVALQDQIIELKATISNLNAQLEQKAEDINDKLLIFSRIAKVAKIKHVDLEQIGFAKVLLSKDFITIDTLPIAMVSWKKRLSDSLINAKEMKLRSWLQSELSLDTLLVRRIAY
jgi:hypothetical protein